MAHSKRNSTAAFFTQSERAELRSTWGTRSTRLTRESFLPFGSCNLCLQPARDPVSCSEQGHLFCRECAISNLLAQSKEIKRLKRAAEEKEAEADLQRTIEDTEQHAKVLKDFEDVQSGLQSSTGDPRKRKRLDTESDGPDRVVKDRRSELNDSASFWVPGQRRSVEKDAVRNNKEHSSCPVTTDERNHGLSLKTMVTVKFKMEKSKAGDCDIKACPSCNKTLSNTTKAVLAKPCGHVLCKACSDQFQLPGPSADGPAPSPSARCYVCEEDITPAKATETNGDQKVKKHRIQRGLVELRSDGTGFAGGGNNMVKREGVAFQVG